MIYPDYEKLFLLEILVDSVNIFTSNLSLSPEDIANLKETCVMFQFLNYPPLIVCEEDFFKSTSSRNDTQLNFKSGKSCLFSIRSSLVPTLPFKFDINVSVMRKLQQKDEKKSVELGTTMIDLGDSFAALMHSSVAEPDLPLQKTKTGTFDLTNKSNTEIGTITAFIRLSCFGQLIVTQFQVGANQDAFMFKGTDPKQIVEIPGDTSKIPQIEVDPTYQQPIEQTREVKPELSYGDTRELVPYMPPEYEMPYVPPPEDDSGDYKEIVAEIRGHSLHIRVPMKSKKAKGEEICKRELMEDMEGKVCKYAPQLNLCDCDFPVPPEATLRCDPCNKFS